MNAGGRQPRIEVPRWIQLVGLPLLLLLTWVLAAKAIHVVFLFLVAGLLAFVLDPLVRGLQRARLPRGFSVVIVYLGFLIVVGLLAFAVVSALAGQTKTAATRLNAYFTDRQGRAGQTGADHDVDRLQSWLNAHHLKGLKIQKEGHKIVKQIRQRDISKYTRRIVTFAEGAAISIGKIIFEAVLLLVVSIYILLDLQRLQRAVNRRFPPRPGERSLVLEIEHALVSYVRGQVALSLIIGTSAGVGLWVFAQTGLLSSAQQYALLFGAWVALTEVIPYLGPWLGAIPPFLYALVTHPISALWVALLFLVIHQLEGHIVVPNVMGTALRLHPLAVIFGLAAGFELYGFAGALTALPFLAVGRAVWEFFDGRFRLQPWGARTPVPVEVDVGDPELVDSVEP
jgi:predicted PurR-regulated permease PerM